MSSNLVEQCHQALIQLQRLKDRDIEQLKSQAFRIATEHFEYLYQNPSLQAMEVCSKGYEDFKEEVTKIFETSSEQDIARMYLQSEAKTSFCSRTLQNEIQQILITGH